MPLMDAWKSERRRTRKRCFTDADSLRGQSLAPFATTVLHHSRSAPRGHAAKKAVHPAAVALLWLIRSLDGGIPFLPGARRNRGSVADHGSPSHDSGCITSSLGCRALRCPQAFVTIPARKQSWSEPPAQLSTSHAHRTQFMQSD
jgi:hypothetical protein